MDYGTHDSDARVDIRQQQVARDAGSPAYRGAIEQEAEHIAEALNRLLAAANSKSRLVTYEGGDALDGAVTSLSGEIEALRAENHRLKARNDELEEDLRELEVKLGQIQDLLGAESPVKRETKASRRKGLPADRMDTPVHWLALNIDVKTKLARAGVRTYGDLVACTEEEAVHRAELTPEEAEYLTDKMERAHLFFAQESQGGEQSGVPSDAASHTGDSGTGDASETRDAMARLVSPAVEEQNSVETGSEPASGRPNEPDEGKDEITGGERGESS